MGKSRLPLALLLVCTMGISISCKRDKTPTPEPAAPAENSEDTEKKVQNAVKAAEKDHKKELQKAVDNAWKEAKAKYETDAGKNETLTKELAELKKKLGLYETDASKSEAEKQALRDKIAELEAELASCKEDCEGDGKTEPENPDQEVVDYLMNDLGLGQDAAAKAAVLIKGKLQLFQQIYTCLTMSQDSYGNCVIGEEEIVDEGGVGLDKAKALEEALRLIQLETMDDILDAIYLLFDNKPDDGHGRKDEGVEESNGEAKDIVEEETGEFSEGSGREEEVEENKRSTSSGAHMSKSSTSSKRSRSESTSTKSSGSEEISASGARDIAPAELASELDKAIYQRGQHQKQQENLLRAVELYNKKMIQADANIERLRKERAAQESQILESGKKNPFTEIELTEKSSKSEESSTTETSEEAEETEEDSSSK